MEIIITLVIAYILFILIHLNATNKQMKLQEYKLVKFKEINNLYYSTFIFTVIYKNQDIYYKVIFETNNPTLGGFDMLESCKQKGIYFEDLIGKKTKTDLGLITCDKFINEDFFHFGHKEHWNELLTIALNEQKECVSEFLLIFGRIGNK